MSQTTNPWVSIALADVQASMLAEALNLAQTRAAQRGQADPFTVHRTKVVARVRNKVASAPATQLSSDPTTVPPELAEQTALLIAYQIALPLSAANANLFSDDIRAAVKGAEKDLDDVASGAMKVSLPDDPLGGNTVSSGGPIQPVGRGDREATRDSLRGL